MQPLALRIIAVVLVYGLFASVAEPAVIHGSGTFDVQFYYDEVQGEFDPPLFGSGSFEIRSQPFDPDNFIEVFESDVLDFHFSFNGHSWDESDVENPCSCSFTADGEPLFIAFNFSNDDAHGTLAWNFEDGNFGFSYFARNELDVRGTSENGQAGSEFDASFRVVPEPGSLALLGLGLAGLGLSRRRKGANAAARSWNEPSPYTTT